MEIKYSEPNNLPKECAFLEENFMNCLTEKSHKDNLPKLKCNMENVLWYFLDCPKYSNLF